MLLTANNLKGRLCLKSLWGWDSRFGKCCLQICQATKGGHTQFTFFLRFCQVLHVFSPMHFCVKIFIGLVIFMLIHKTLCSKTSSFVCF